MEALQGAIKIFYGIASASLKANGKEQETQMIVKKKANSIRTMKISLKT